MARHKGKPSSADKSGGTGLRPDLPLDQVEQDRKLTDMYTEDGEKVKQNVHMRHRNRNPDKNDATNAGGYRQ